MATGHGHWAWPLGMRLGMAAWGWGGIKPLWTRAARGHRAARQARVSVASAFGARYSEPAGRVLLASRLVSRYTNFVRLFFIDRYILRGIEANGDGAV
jgi:hypothetical protein